MSDGMMIFFAMIFVAVVLLSQGLIVPVFGESRQMRKKLQSRLGDWELSFDDPKHYFLNITTVVFYSCMYNHMIF